MTGNDTLTKIRRTCSSVSNSSSLKDMEFDQRCIVFGDPEFEPIQQKKVVPITVDIFLGDSSTRLLNRNPCYNADESGWVKVSHPIPETLNGSDGTIRKEELVGCRDAHCGKRE